MLFTLKGPTLYSVSLVISILLIVYISFKNPINSSLFVVTVVPGASKLCGVKISDPNSTVISDDDKALVATKGLATFLESGRSLDNILYSLER